MENSSIQAFYNKRSVLVTGGTGYIGKLLIEKLLRSCPDIGNIFVLARDKKGIEVKDRITEIINTPVFDQLKQKNPQVFQKIVPIQGDVVIPGLGIRNGDLELIKSRVSVVYHVAARIKFDRNLKEAAEINVKGTKHVLEVCHQLRELQALVYVSTCYVQTRLSHVKEEIYSPPMQPQELLDAIDFMKPEDFKMFTDRSLEGHPNVYSFTKAIAEHMVKTESGKLPVAIVRPSIVTPAWKDSLAGWSDNLNGPSAFLVGTATGFLRIVNVRPDIIGDLIPAEFPVNLIISAAWRKATQQGSDITVYNCATGTVNPIKWEQFRRIAVKKIKKCPSEKIFWYPSMTFATSKTSYKLKVVLFHYILAYIMDIISRIKGQQARLVRLYDRSHRALVPVEYYACRQWHFHSSNMMKLLESMSETDSCLFNFDVRLIDWNQYLETYVSGVRKYLLKEDPSTIPSAIRKMNRLFWVRLVMLFVLLGAALLLFKASSVFVHPSIFRAYASTGNSPLPNIFYSSLF